MIPTKFENPGNLPDSKPMRAGVKKRKTPTNVLSQHILNLLIVIPPLHNQPLTTVNRPLRTQLRVQELDNVLGLTAHSPANIGNVGKHGLFRALACDLGRDHGVSAFFTGQLGVVCV